MDIVIEYTDFHDVEETLFWKKSRFLRLIRRSSDIGLWSPYPFGDLPERIKRENNWLTRNYDGIEWFDGNINSKYFMIQLRDITLQKCT